MRGFLSLEPDDGTHARLIAAQNRLRDGLARQGVHFPDRMGITLIAWPFGSVEDIGDAAGVVRDLAVSQVALSKLRGLPNGDRPAEIGFSTEDVAPLQAQLFTALKTLLDPDPPKPAFLRLARVSPASRKVGIALRTVHFEDALTFAAKGFAIWTQTPQGFEVRHEIVAKQDW